MLQALPSGWRSVTLEEVCERVTVGHVGPMANEYVEAGVPFLRSQNVQPFRIDTQGIRYISDDFDRKLRKSALKPWDVVVVRTGYPGTAAVIPPHLQRANCADLVVITPSPELDPWFLTCIFNSVWGKDTVAGNLVGVAQQHFNVGAAKAMKIGLPPLPTQQRIAAILSAYDELIENNTLRIAILEEMARRLYEEWFVHFRFPGHKEEEPAEAMPQGWEEVGLDEIMTFQGGAQPPKSEWHSSPGVDRTRMIQIRDYSTNNHIEYVSDTPNLRRCAPLDIMIARYGASVGRICWGLEGAYNVALVKVVPKQAEHREFLRSFLSSDTTQSLIIGMSGRAAQAGFNKSILPSIRISVPKDRLLLVNFDRAVAPFRRMQFQLNKKNANLRAQRDMLLPKLISGEIDVSGSEELLEAAE